jgi:hypothetical protein
MCNVREFELQIELLTSCKVQTRPWRRAAGDSNLYCQFHIVALRNAAIYINFPDQCDENRDCGGNRFSELLTLEAPSRNETR